jgi:hypothetical protein
VREFGFSVVREFACSYNGGHQRGSMGAPSSDRRSWSRSAATFFENRDDGLCALGARDRARELALEVRSSLYGRIRGFGDRAATRCKRPDGEFATAFGDAPRRQVRRVEAITAE